MRGLLLVVTPLALLALVAAALLLRSRASADRIEALFRRPARPPKPLAADHYYRRYWS